MAKVWTLALCFTVCVAIESTVAYQFTVGGSKGWTVPSGSDNETYNQWAERNRFQIGDTLLFKYDKSEDSVLQVSQASYNTCNTSGPIASYTDGNTIFKFLIHGPFYFISGNQSRCQLGEKLIVVVLAPCHFGKGKNCRLAPSPSPAHVPSPTPSPSPSPSPSATAPGISPTISPSPSPSPGVSSPSPSPGISSPSPGVSSPSPPPGVSSPSPSPTIASVPSPASITSPTPPAAAFPPSASTTSPPSPSSSDASAFPSFLNFLIPLFFAALLNAKIATI